LVEHRLWLKVLIGLALGVITGILLGPGVGWVPPSTSATIVSWLALPGTLFLVLIQMIVVPLVFASVVRGLAASSGGAELKELGLGGGAFFVVTTAVATAIGIALALWIDPGRFVDAAQVRASLGSAPTSAASAARLPEFTDVPALVVALLPTNPLESMASGQMLQVILFAVIVGVALVNIPASKSAPLFDLLGSLQEVCMKVVSWAMRLAPLAVFGLMTRLVASVGFQVLGGMAVYMATVLLGLLLLVAGYLTLLVVLAQRSPLSFLGSIREVMLLAFSTSSSAAVMPLSIQTAEERLQVRPSVARFLVPLGATVNMNGTALYQGVATVFLAQVFAVPLDPGALLFVVAMAVMASIGSPGTPGAGIVILAVVLEGVGVPASGVALLLGVDRLLDMARTAVNVTGDMTACVVMERGLTLREVARRHPHRPSVSEP
jgi:Na+/H+-dicarboxylate symporter